MNMKRIYSVLAVFLLFCSNVFSQEKADAIGRVDEVVQTMKIASPEDLIARATIAYEQGNYTQTIADYESLVSVFGTSPELYYNLGNAYFKNKDYAKAILNYERCLIYDPANGDASANLELAKANCVDKIESIQPIIFKQWSDVLSNTMSCGTWSVLSIIFFLLFVICIFLYFFVRKVTVRKTGFYVGIVSIILCFVCNIYANQQKDRIMSRDYAIVMQPTVTVRSSPAESGTQLFSIHEGLKVKVRSTLSDWSEVELSDGNVGWLPSSAVEKI